MACGPEDDAPQTRWHCRPRVAAYATAFALPLENGRSAWSIIVAAMCKPRATCTSRSGSAHSSRRSGPGLHTRRSSVDGRANQRYCGLASDARPMPLRASVSDRSARGALQRVWSASECKPYTDGARHGNKRTHQTRAPVGAGLLLLGVPADVRDVARDHRHDAVQAGKGSACRRRRWRAFTQASNARPGRVLNWYE